MNTEEHLAGLSHGTVLVTGATGLVGSAVVAQLAGTGWKVRGMTHSESKTEALQAAGCNEVVIGDVSDYSSMEPAFHGVDAVIHSVGLLMEKGGLTYDKVNTGGTRNAVNASIANGITKFVVMSVIGIGPGDKNPYASSKWDCEQVVESSDLDYTVLRCSYVIGKQAAIVGLLKQMVSLPVTPVIGTGQQLLQMVSDIDVAKCLVGALDNYEASRQVLELCGPTPYTYDEILDLVASIQGRRMPRKAHVPAGLVKLVLPVAEKIPGSVVSRPTIDMLLRNSVCDPRNVANMFGVELILLEDALRGAYG